MKPLLFAAMFGTASMLTLSGQAQAAGCLSGAAVGGVAGHVAGHHAVLGALAGCAVGHHMNHVQKERERQGSDREMYGRDAYRDDTAR